MKNMTYLILVLASGFCLSAQAKGEFVKFSSLGAEAKKSYDQAYKAQFKINVSEGSECTGTYISNQGHGLTAAHCIKKCMPIKPGLEGLKHWPVEAWITTKDGVTKQSKHKVTAYPWSYPQLCEAVINGRAVSIEVLAGSKGRHVEPLPIDVVFYFKQYYWITQGEVEGYKDQWHSSFHNGWGMGGDFAIFKVVDDKPVKTDCLKISKAASFSGDHYSLSYPWHTSVSSKVVNRELYLSTGDVYQGNYFGSEVIKIEDSEHRYLNSTLWAYPGSSGASLVDPRDNSISGVLSAVVGREGMKGSELPDARFISSKLIREQAGEVLDKVSCD